MGDIVTAATLATKLSNHGLAVGIAMAFLTGRQFTMLRMTEGAGLVGVTGLALNQGVVYIGMATAADLFGLIDGEGDVERIMGVGMATQAVRVSEFCPVPFFIMTIEA